MPHLMPYQFILVCCLPPFYIRDWVEYRDLCSREHWGHQKFSDQGNEIILWHHVFLPGSDEGVPWYGKIRECLDDIKFRLNFRTRLNLKRLSSLRCACEAPDKFFISASMLWRDRFHRLQCQRATRARFLQNSNEWHMENRLRPRRNWPIHQCWQSGRWTRHCSCTSGGK